MLITVLIAGLLGAACVGPGEVTLRSEHAYDDGPVIYSEPITPDVVIERGHRHYHYTHHLHRVHR